MLCVIVCPMILLVWAVYQTRLSSVLSSTNRVAIGCCGFHGCALSQSIPGLLAIIAVSAVVTVFAILAAVVSAAVVLAVVVLASGALLP